ncbi:MAG: tetratricopeptide repeat protein [Burkholderiales bacterium]|nr:tetratricopeptide repeat protein [Burkholderiales bacterium]
MDQPKLIGAALAEARDRYAKGNLQEAAELCAAVLQIDEKQDGALHLLGLIASRIGDPEKALDFLSKAIEANPDPKYYRDCAGVCEVLGLKDVAEDCLRKAASLDAPEVSRPSLQRAGIVTDVAPASRPVKRPALKVGEAIGRALAFHQAGRLDEAESLYHEVLVVDPEQADALHLLGLIHHQRGNHPMAVELMQRAIGIAPHASVPYSNCGSALQSMGRFDEAEACYRQAIALDRSNADGYLNLGTVLEAKGKTGEAEACYREALRLIPDYAKAHNNLGKLLAESGRQEEGIAHARRAIEIDPGYAGAFSNLAAFLNQQGKYEEAIGHARRAAEINPGYAAAWSNWGVSCKELERYDEAVGLFRRALECDPDHVESLNNLGAALRELRRFDEAILPLERAVALKPDFAGALGNRGVLYIDKELPEKAIYCLERAIELKPEDPAGYLNLGTAWRALARFDDAIECYRKALSIRPDYPDAINNLGTIFQLQGKTDEVIRFYQEALSRVNLPMIRWNLSLALVASGDLERGWPESEYRWLSVLKGQARPFPQPWWDGRDPAGKTLLLWGEQGVGDEVVFASVIPDLIRLAGHCVVECEPRLATLFARSFPEAEVIPRTYPPDPRALRPDIDFQIPIQSTFRWVRPGLESFPHHHGFLVPDPQRRAFWKARLDALGSGIKVGISWRSRHRAALRDVHYTRIEDWGPVFSVPGLTFVNLQYDDCREEIDTARKLFGVKIHAFEEIDLLNDLDDAAALTSAVDLMISVGNAAAGIGGAVGAPLWLMMNSGNWVLLGTDRLPWLPEARLFLKPLGEDWQRAMEGVAAALQTLGGEGR